MQRPRMRGKIKRKSAVASLAELGEGELEQMARKARYEPSPYHKSAQEAERWGLSRAVHRPDTTLCEAGTIGGRRDAVRLLRLGIRLGMVSETRRGDWPQNVWAVDDKGVAYEAQLSNRGVGEYHGYPMKRYDGFTGFVKRVWGERSQ